jgi:ComF family protein
VLDLVYPERCAACDAWIEQPGLCPVCRMSLWRVGVACDVCGEPLAAAEATTCRRCASSPPPFRRVFAPWRYGGELATAVLRFKYGRRRDLARPLAHLLAREYVRAIRQDETDLIVPVPLHPRRLRARGFSQAHELARALRSIASVPSIDTAPTALARGRDTAEQAGLSRLERARNVANAFDVRRAALVRDRRVLLVDDVVTTGATAAACARALVRAGAAAVSVLALARAEG